MLLGNGLHRESADYLLGGMSPLSTFPIICMKCFQSMRYKFQVEIVLRRVYGPAFLIPGKYINQE